MAKREVKRVVRRPRAPKVPVPTVDELQAQVRDLCNTITDLRERMKYADESKDSALSRAADLRNQLDRVTKERDAGRGAELEVARLNGMIQGLERAGKIEPQVHTGFDGFAGVGR